MSCSWRWRVQVLGVLALSCSTRPDLDTLPELKVTFDDSQDEAAQQESPNAEDEDELAESAAPGDLPDPEPVRAQRQVELELSYEQGRLILNSHRKLRLAQASPTPRRIGRFAAELWIGDLLLERVRFGFPLLGAPEEGELERGLRTSTTVMIPDLERATELRILDRKTRESIRISWPLSADAAPALGLGGASAAK